MFGFNFLEPGKVILFWLPGMATVREESVQPPSGALKRESTPPPIQ